MSSTAKPLVVSPAFRLSPLQRLQEWRRSCTQLRSLTTNGISAYRLASRAICDKQAIQRKWELIALIGRVRALRPSTVVEIGSCQGGTLYVWAQLATSTATLVSIDLPGGPFGGGYSAHQPEEFARNLRDRQTLHCLRCDSHRPGTKRELERLLKKRPVDFLFIDGDHAYDGVKSDFEMYSPLVRPGGLIGFHDISANANPACSVDRFWNEVKHGFRYWEFVDRDGYDVWGGIGLIEQGSGKASRSAA